MILLTSKYGRVETDNHFTCSYQWQTAENRD